MKKRFVLLSLLICLSSCGRNTTVPKVEFEIGSAQSEVFELGYSSLTAKFYSYPSSFALVTHQGNSCLCFQEFSHLLQKYNDQRVERGLERIPFYSFDTNLIESRYSEVPIDKILSGYINFYIVDNGQIVATYSSIAKKDVRFFSSPKDFESIFERHIKNQPIKNLSYVSLEFFKQSILDNPNSDCVLFSVRSGCPDCTYCIPNCLLPYTRSNNLKRPIYIIDLEDYYTTSAEKYNIIKSTLQLTKESSEDFGYGDGYVPTYQYWKNGKLEDAGVFANDEVYYDYDVTYNDIIIASYFDGNRPTKFTDTNLIGTEISYYNSDYLIHSQILEKFLSYYC